MRRLAAWYLLKVEHRQSLMQNNRRSQTDTLGVQLLFSAAIVTEEVISISNISVFCCWSDFHLISVHYLFDVSLCTSTASYVQLNPIKCTSLSSIFFSSHLENSFVSAHVFLTAKWKVQHSTYHMLPTGCLLSTYTNYAGAKDITGYTYGGDFIAQTVAAAN